MKYDRQSEIISLIGEREIETQEELLEGLREKGYMVTQATISRDIRELKLVKVSAGAGGRYKYATAHREENTISKKYRNLLIETVEKIDRANNITVVKTIVGMASGAAAAIDSMGRDDLVGSVAGDDTIIIVMRTNEAAQSLVDDLNEIISTKR
ncbi:MAG: arginine repressor [Clostridia bacterium]|nr:arginine repressor [Clostridia bacterium]